ncbi:LysR substrate-binding domain-containing protein [Paenarthrobacter sp. NPDC089714]|uniref:LysR substrate-binding domain-containing protein n=1 Tax=Paenarthrobacter sp. NPDC089714 TaxID=3364377 RepID=UPI003819F06B
MDTRRLRYFVKIVDSGTITRAAETLHLAQPALSQHLNALEAEFKQRLLVRSRNGVIPTAAGKSLYRYAQGILRLEDEARREINTESSSPTGTVTIGLGTYTLSSSLTIPTLEAIRSRFPRIVIRVVETLTVIHSQAIRMGLVDAALIYDPGPVKGVRFERISTDALVLVTPADFELPDSTDTSVSVSALGNLDFMLPSPTHTLRGLVEQAFGSLGMELTVAIEMDHGHSLREAVQLGLGVTVLPEPAAVAMFSDDQFTIRRITDPGLSAAFALATSDDGPQSAAAEVVIETIRQIILDAGVSPS